MKLGIIGLGYAGLCTAACLARKFDVVGVDVDERRISLLNAGKAPIQENGLVRLLQTGRGKETLRFSSDYKSLRDRDALFVTVGTPSKQDGSIDLSHFRSACISIGNEIAKTAGKPLVVIKSTVVPGTATKVARPLLEKESGKTCGTDFGMCSNPEFLREGAAIEDTLNPYRIVIGPFDKSSGLTIRSLYARFYGRKLPTIIETTPENAELIKYASNAFLATKISFINFIARICERLSAADVAEVAAGMGLDPRIGPRFLQAGPGFGGSCLPKDSKALRAYAEQLGVDVSLMSSVIVINDTQPGRILLTVERALGTLKAKEVAVLGVAFKAGSDDVRESRGLLLSKGLLERGASVRITDPMAMDGAKRELAERVTYHKTPRNCIRGADAAIVMTEWAEFKKLKPEDFAKLMRTPFLFDAKRLYDPAKYQSHGLSFMAIGRGPSP